MQPDYSNNQLYNKEKFYLIIKFFHEKSHSPDNAMSQLREPFSKNLCRNGNFSWIEKKKKKNTSFELRKNNFV